MPAALDRDYDGIMSAPVIMAWCSGAISRAAVSTSCWWTGG